MAFLNFGTVVFVDVKDHFSRAYSGVHDPVREKALIKCPGEVIVVDTCDDFGIFEVEPRSAEIV